MKLKKLVLISISIILLGLILQIVPSNYTGMLTLKGQYFPATIQVSPKITIYGESIKIKVTSPYTIYRGQKIDSWIGNKIYFYNEGKRRGEKTICSSNKCRGNFIIEYDLPSEMYTGAAWKQGTYNARVYDYLNKKDIEDSFQLFNTSNPLIRCKETDKGEDIYHKGETYSYLSLIGNRTKKIDKCTEVSYYSSKKLTEYYCCDSKSPNYDPKIGMCSKIEDCKIKCQYGSCYDYK